MSLLESFIGKPREFQKEIIKNIEEAIRSGYDNILLSAPTGIGKSYIAMCLANAYDSSAILTATTDLQNQYLNDFDFVEVIKGRNNFPCMLYKKQGFTCGDVPHKVCKKCRYYNTIDDYDDNTCHYYKQKYDALLADHTIFNYHYYFTLALHTFEIPERDVMIFDEVHLLENILISFYQLDISPYILGNANHRLKREINDIRSLLELLSILEGKYSAKIEELEMSSKKLQKQLTRYEEILNRLEFLHEVIVNDKDNYVVETINDHVKATPIEIKNYARQIFNKGKIRLFMSATISKELFDMVFGIDTKLIEVDSPFPIENRYVRFLNIERFNKANLSNPNTLRMTADYIEKIMKKHEHERGLLLTSSYWHAKKLFELLPKEYRQRIFLSNEVKRTDIVNVHSQKHNSVILSPSLWEGIDLKGDLARFVVVIKTPYLDLSDKRIRIKMNKNKLWYQLHTAMKLIQGVGRGVRSVDDYCHIYVLDANAWRLVKMLWYRLPKWFRDACIESKLER